MTSPIRYTVGLALLAATWWSPGCKASGERRPDDTQGDQPAPSSSVITVGVAFGTCKDLAICESECDAGSADRCRRLAATYALGDGVTKDEARATTLYELACDKKDAPACVFAGQMHEYAHGVPKDDAKAVALYQRACDAGWLAGCYNLAIMLENGRGVGRDVARALTLYDAACTAGATPACQEAKALRGAPPGENSQKGREDQKE